MDQQVYAMKIADIFNVDVRKKILASVNKKIKSIFPSTDSLYSKDIVKKHDLIHTNFTNFHISNNIPANPINNLSFGVIPGSCQIIAPSTALNNSASLNNNNYNFTNTKKKYFEEDNNNVISNGNTNVKKGFSAKNKKTVGKLQYREKVISSSINSNNNDVKKNMTENFDNAKEIDKINLNGITINNALVNQVIPETDLNSNETTSTSSKDDNFITNNKQGDILLNKKDEKIFGELIEVIKFDSEKLNGLNKHKNSDDVSCKEVNKSNFNSANSQAFSSNFSNSNFYNYKNLFSCRESSRFNFVQKNSNYQSNSSSNKNISNNNKNGKNIENVEIPEFVLELIRKKISRQKLTKTFEFMEDILYCDELLQKEYTNENHWAEFILENKNTDKDKELIFDFEIINKSLTDKFKTYYLK